VTYHVEWDTPAGPARVGPFADAADALREFDERVQTPGHPGVRVTPSGVRPSPPSCRSSPPTLRDAFAFVME
jgi:hypothetical protein